MNKGLRYMLYFVAWLLMTYAGAAVLLDQYGQRRPRREHYDAIIVLGCRVESTGVASLSLQARTQKAVELFEQGYADKIILTGGVGEHAPAESKAAFTYATTVLGVSPEVFILEETSRTTEENAKYAKEASPEAVSVLIVSDAYHVYRSERVFERYFEHVDGSGRVPIPYYRLKGTLREVAAVLKYWWLGRI